jgi:hypothetical protein
MNLLSRITLISSLALLSLPLYAQVVINEYSCSNWGLTTDNYGSHEDWIELYNPSPGVVNIGNYCLSDKISQPDKWRFPANVLIPANSYLVIYASGRNESTGGVYHTNFHLTQTKLPTEHIVFSDPLGTIIDQVTLTITQNHNSVGRIPNAGANWNVYLTPTPGSANDPLTARQRYATAPAFNMDAGFYPSAVTVSITTTEPNSAIYYTLDGTVPSTSSTLYSGPVIIDSTAVLKAITYVASATIATSPVNFSTYFINETHTLPVVSIAGNDLQVLADGDQSLRPLGTIEYFDMNKQRKTAGYGEFNSHGQDSWANDQRSLDFIMRDEFGYNYALQEQLFSNLTPRSEFQRIILRAAGDDNYPAAHHASNDGSAHVRDAYLQNLAKTGNLKVDVRTATKSIVYLNGIYWGVYDLRELPDDHDYTDYYYHQDKYHLQYIETWGSTWAEYGGPQALTDWTNFHNYVMSHDMTIPAVWDTVTSQLDVYSLVDYVIVNSVSVCSDWLNYNTGWWRGLDSAGEHKKWGYILWDNDAIFGFYVNYTNIPDKGPNALPCNVEGNLSDPKGHIDLLNKLRQNPDFNHYYISRYIDLSNTIFSCDNMLNTLDSITTVIDPEMTRHAGRWFGTYNEWQQNVQQLRDYIQIRCAVLPSLMDTCYNLTGPYPLYITADPIGTGKVKVNSLTISDFPWTGNYHGGIPVRITAYPDTLNGFSFDSWESFNHTALPSIYSANAELQLTTSDTLIAHFLQQPVYIREVSSDFHAVAYPSVFSNETTVEFYQKEKNPVHVTLYSTVGEPVLFIKGNDQAGTNSFKLNLNGRGIAAGVYLLNFKSDSFNKTLRLVYAGE